MSDQSNLCTRCGADNLRDGYFCLNCKLMTSNQFGEYQTDELYWPRLPMGTMPQPVEGYDASFDVLDATRKPGVYMPRSIEKHAATVSRLCNLAPDDDGEEVIPMTADEMAAMNERMAASPEPNF